LNIFTSWLTEKAFLSVIFASRAFIHRKVARPCQQKTLALNNFCLGRNRHLNDLTPGELSSLLPFDIDPIALSC
jgi:hypothetical protein